MRIPSLVALSLIVLVGPVSTSYAADEPLTCLGQPVTIVGGEGRVTGTEGPDVIVMADNSSVDALGGDDLVCILGGEPEGTPGDHVYPEAEVNAGAGNDVVSSEDLESGWETTVALGPGEDRFLGGNSSDKVYGSDPDSADTERDEISTGGSADEVHSGRSSVANDDVVTTGWSGDLVVGVPPSSAGVLDVGGGNNFVAFDLTAASSTHWRLDVATREVRYGLETGRWAGRVARWQFFAERAPGVQRSTCPVRTARTG